MDNLDAMLAELGFADDSTPATESVDTIENPEDTTSIFLTSLRSACESFEEYEQIVVENANELEVYGLIHDADAVIESTKNIVKLNKFAKLHAEEKKACIRLAKLNNDVLYKKYSKHRKLMSEARTTIFDKYEAKAKVEARKVIANSKRKASQMKSKTGANIVNKMDKAIAKEQKKTK